MSQSDTHTVTITVFGREFSWNVAPLVVDGCAGWGVYTGLVPDPGFQQAWFAHRGNALSWADILASRAEGHVYRDRMAAGWGE